MQNEKAKTGTKSKTSSFGVSKRENHDSSPFYDTNMYKSLSIPRKIIYKDNSSDIPDSILDTIIHGDSQDMSLLPDDSVHLMVTSPPYNVTKDYDEDLSLSEYLSLLKSVFLETWRVLVPGGRVAINIANIGRKPYIPLHSFVIQIMLEIGYHMRGEIIWNKGASAGISCAWGSFASASNPCLRDVHEYILIFSKLTNSLEKGEKINTIQKEDFVEWTKSIWNFPAESAKKVGHPAPFPEELPRRLIHFYTYEGDVVLDPFMGSGTTAIAALKSRRHFIGFDNSLDYVNLARSRIKNRINI
ncbi:MAG: site-specific DNA-methyltransferase [Candidatus Lokiarchaeota archaeon]|nr:site-specific DNA-methyltransferase [Candidatus Lokiarchaeota archaeon]